MPQAVPPSMTFKPAGTTDPHAFRIAKGRMKEDLPEHLPRKALPATIQTIVNPKRSEALSGLGDASLVEQLARLRPAAIAVLQGREFSVAGVSGAARTNFQQLQELAETYKGALAKVLEGRIRAMTDTGSGGQKTEAFLNFSKEAFQALNVLGRSDFQQIEKAQAKVLGHLKEAFHQPEIFLQDAFNPVRIIAESFSLYNQLLKATKQTIKVQNADPEKKAKEIVKDLKDKGLSAAEIKTILEDTVKVAMIFTSHPTLGVPTGRRIHLNTVSEILETHFGSKMASGDITKVHVPKTGESLSATLETLTKSPIFNEQEITPLDETKALIQNVEPLVRQLPIFAIALENAYQAAFPRERDNILSLTNILSPRKWTTTDADGNPSNNFPEYLKSFVEKRLKLFESYQKQLETLMDGYTEVYPEGILIHHPEVAQAETGNRDFATLYNQFVKPTGRRDVYKALMDTYVREGDTKPLLKVFQENINNLRAIQSKIENYTEGTDRTALNQAFQDIQENVKEFSAKDLLEPLRAIEKNKRYNYENGGQSYHEGTPPGYHTRQFIKAIRAFGDTLGHADIRQGAEYFPHLRAALDRSAGVQSYKGETATITARVKQTDDLLNSASLGEVNRLILSMTKSSEDLQNALAVAEKKGLFTPAEAPAGAAMKWTMPKSGLEIVPLTELIPDLDAAYKETSIKPLSDPKFRQYLIANDGVLTKMYGPSDSGKWSGPFPSWSAMLKAQYFDSRVVEIFNDFLHDKLSGRDSSSEGGAEAKWERHLQKLTDLVSLRAGNSEDFKEIRVVREALTEFKASFAAMTEDEVSLWKQAQRENPNLKKGLRYKIIDGFGGPVIRGNGADGRKGVSPTTLADTLYEQTVQGSQVDKLRQVPNAIDFITDRLRTVIGIAGDKLKSLKETQEPLFVDPFFFKFLDDSSKALRQTLREDTIGIDYQDDEEVTDVNKLRSYVKMIAVSTPALFLGLYKNSSRPITRSGEQIGTLLAKHDNDLGKMVDALAEPDLRKILNDMRAIPIAAFYNLGGSAHISVGGVRGLDPVLKQQFIDFYKQSREASSWSGKIIKNFMTDMVDSWEKELFKITPDLMEHAATVNHAALGMPYDAGQDRILQATKQDNQALRRLIAEAKGYRVSNVEDVKLNELLQNDPLQRAELLAERQNLNPLKRALSLTTSAIFRHTQQGNAGKQNPFSSNNIPPELNRAFNTLITAIASSGDGSID